MTTTTRSSTLVALAALTVLGTLVTGCNNHDLKPVDLEGSAVRENALPLDVNRKVDVLLVIDNSGSMGGEQSNLAANFGPFIAELEKAGADYRIGLTTTDIGGKDCAGEATGGTLQLSSCLDRPEAFVFNGNDEFAEACEAHCTYTDADLQIQPTAVTGSKDGATRPWIQSYSGVSNLPEGVETLDAFQCFAPQGISGCGWESPLEAMSRALENMLNPERPEHGFLRDDALLAVLVVTDEVDCSYNPSHYDALFEDGTFFAEGADWATSAVCWNAGTECDGESPYSGCYDVNRGPNGAVSDDGSDAVLQPVSRYVEMLEGVAAQKTSGREVLVSVIAGVPLDYQETGTVHYADHDNAVEQEKYGIGEGCSNVIDGQLQTAVPPVRLVTFAEAFPSASNEHPNLYSVCSEDYRPALADIVAGITVELPPACYGACVKDQDGSTPELDYNCNVYQTTEDGEEEQLPECARDEADAHVLPADADACWIALTGEDMDSQCQVDGQNVEFKLLRRAGVEVPDASVAAACELSTLDAEACVW